MWTILNQYYYTPNMYARFHDLQSIFRYIVRFNLENNLNVGSTIDICAPNTRLASQCWCGDENPGLLSSEHRVGA